MAWISALHDCLQPFLEYIEWIVVQLSKTLASLAFWPLVEASRQMDAFCGGLGPGMSWADIRARADDLGYEVSPVVAGQALVQDPRSYGRRECQLRFDGKGLAQAR